MSDAGHHSPLDVFLGATPKRTGRNLISIVVLAIALITAAVLFVRFFAGSRSPYYSAPVEVGNIVPLISERGIVSGSDERTIRARFQATVTAVSGPASGRVGKGQILARLDPASVEQALRASRAAAAKAEIALEAAFVTVEETSSRLARFESIWRRSGQRVPSLNELEAARADAGRARLQEAAARANLQAARLQLQANARRLAGAVIRSPIDGYVVSRHVEPGRQVRAGATLFVLASDRGRMTIAVPVTNAQASLFPPGVRATARIDDLPGTVQAARLARLVPEGARTRAVFVLEDAARDVVPGMRAMLEIELPGHRNALLVPDAALEFVPGASAGRGRDRIYLIGDDGEPRRVYVSAGASDGKRTEIFASGVMPGAQVITGWRDAPANGGEPGR